MPLIEGTDQDDTLVGSEDHDVIRGLLGRDYLFGGGGNDRLEGGEGDDLLLGGLGDDLLLGGEGNDSIGENDGGTNDQLFGEEGDDFVYYYGAYGGVSSSLLDGGGGNDLIRHYHFAAGAAASAMLIGGTGADRISTYGGGQIAIDAGADSDLVEIIDYQTDYAIALGSGSDVLRIDSNQFFLPVDRGIVVSDFAAGDLGDSLSLIPYLAHQLNRSVNGAWNFAGNPFGLGYLRLEQRGADTVIQIDRDAGLGVESFEDFVTLSNVTASSLTARNLGGYASNGAATPGVTIDGGAMPDFRSGTSGDDLMRGFGGGDGLFGGAGADLLEGGEGDDILDGEIGDDVVHGGEGNDTITDFVNGSDSLYGEGGNDSLSVDRQFYYAAPNATILLDGGAGNDQLRFASGVLHHDATIIGGSGNDHINVYLGRNVTIDAGEGDDFVDIDVGIGTALITLGAGKDTLALSMYLAPVVGFTVTDFQAGNAGDTMYFTPILQRLVTGWEIGSDPFAQDFLRVARQGTDIVLLYDKDGAGTAFSFAILGRYTGLDGSGLTAYNFGWDFVRVAIAGTAGADNLDGTAGSDELIGFAGGDLLNGGAGLDIMRGGAGDDRYLVQDSGDRIIEAAGEGYDTVYTIGDYALNNASAVEALTVYDRDTTNAATLFGNDLANVIYGNQGNNTLYGGGGTDTFYGLGGDDFFLVDDLTDTVFEVAGQGYDTVYTTGDFALNNFSSVEALSVYDRDTTNGLTLFGNNLANVIYGNNGSNALLGGGGADTFYGLGGDDRIVIDSADDVVLEVAGGGNDTVYTTLSYQLVTDQSVETLTVYDRTTVNTLSLTGNNLVNLIYGNNGANNIDGKGGADTLYGMAGADIFTFTNGPLPGAADTLADFSVVDDIIALDDVAFLGIGPTGALNASAFVVGSAPADADDRIIYNNATGQLFFDADGNGAGAAVHFATVNAGTMLTASDFTVI